MGWGDGRVGVAGWVWEANNDDRLDMAPFFHLHDWYMPAAAILQRLSTVLSRWPHVGQHGEMHRGKHVQQAHWSCRLPRVISPESALCNHSHSMQNTYERPRGDTGVQKLDDLCGKSGRSIRAAYFWSLAL